MNFKEQFKGQYAHKIFCKEIPDEFLYDLTNNDLNMCDKCSIINDWTDLVWLDDGFYCGNKKAQDIMQKGCTAICKGCANDLNIDY